VLWFFGLTDINFASFAALTREFAASLNCAGTFDAGSFDCGPADTDGIDTLDDEEPPELFGFACTTDATLETLLAAALTVLLIFFAAVLTTLFTFAFAFDKIPIV
jgi:hypothetical protein